MRCDPRPQREYFWRQQNFSATAEVERRVSFEVGAAVQILVELGGGSLSGLRRGQHAVLGSPVVFVEVEEHQVRAHYAELRVAVVSYGDFFGENLHHGLHCQNEGKAPILDIREDSKHASLKRFPPCCSST